MDSTISALIGTGIGASSPLLLKLCDYFFENKKHRMELTKMYFEKKLIVIQAFVSSCTQLSGTMINNVTVMEKLKEHNFFKDRNLLEQEMYGKIDFVNNKAIEEVGQLSAVSSAASMFVDFDIDPERISDLAKNIHIGKSNIQNYTNPIYEYIKRFGYKSENEGSQDLEYLKLKNEYFTHIDSIKDSYKTITKLLYLDIKQARIDIKKLAI